MGTGSAADVLLLGLLGLFIVAAGDVVAFLAAAVVVVAVAAGVRYLRGAP